VSLATTVARILSVVDGTTGVENVTDGRVTETVRSTAEAARNVSTGEMIQSWEVLATPKRVPHGADGFLETELDFEIVAHYAHASGTRATFRSLLDAVMVRLADPAIGFPQLTPEGVTVPEFPEWPVKLPTGQSSWTARIRGSLSDTSST
jgi:hypothetical protein